MVALVLAVIALGFGKDLIESREVRHVLTDVHRTIGLCIAVLTFGRLAVRIRHRAPDTETPKLFRYAGYASQGVLYTLLVAMPVLGLVQTGAAKAHPTLFGLVPLPSFTGRDRELADTLAQWHEWGAWVMITVIGVHACAALYHHYVRRDGVLVRMVPVLAVRAPRSR